MYSYGPRACWANRSQSRATATQLRRVMSPAPAGASRRSPLLPRNPSPRAALWRQPRPGSRRGRPTPRETRSRTFPGTRAVLAGEDDLVARREGEDGYGVWSGDEVPIGAPAVGEAVCHRRDLDVAGGSWALHDRLPGRRRSVRHGPSLTRSAGELLVPRGCNVAECRQLPALPVAKRPPLAPNHQHQPTVADRESQAVVAAGESEGPAARSGHRGWRNPSRPAATGRSRPSRATAHDALKAAAGAAHGPRPGGLAQSSRRS